MSVDDDNYARFYRALVDVEGSSDPAEYSIGEVIGDTLPVIASCLIRREDCTLSNISPLQIELNKLIVAHTPFSLDRGFLSAVYWLDGRLYISYPTISVTVNNMRLLESKMRTMWGDCFASVLDEGFVRMCLGRGFELMGVFFNDDTSLEPRMVDASSAFEDARLELYNSGVLTVEDVSLIGVDAFNYLYLSTHNITRSIVDSPLRKHVEVQPEYDISAFSDTTSMDLNHEDDRIELQDMLRMWNISRFKSISEWYAIGEICYDQHNARAEGMEQWQALTSMVIGRMTSENVQVPSYLQSKVTGQIRVRYYTFKRNRTTIKTAAWVAREDSPAEYAKWHAGWCASSLIESTSGLVMDLSRAYYKRFFLDFICESEGKGYTWYYYDETSHRLVCDRSMSEVSKRTLWKFRNDYRRMRRVLESQRNDESTMSCEEEDEYEKADDYSRILKKIEGLESKLGTGFGDSVIRGAAKYFHNPNVTQYFNANQDLLCAKTGVIVATRRDIFVRSGRPEDYLTTEIEAHFINMSWSHPIVLRILYWAKQTFIDNELVEYWFMFLASLLRGGNPDKIFPIIYGPKSNNSKSAWIRAIQKVLGQKCMKCTMALLTMEEKSPHGPTSLLVDIGDARLVLGEEAEEGGRPLRAGLLKNMSGSDTYYAARKHKDGVQITPSAVIGIVTNSIPEMTTKDEAMKSRSVVIPVDSMWVPKGRCPSTIEEQFEKRIFEADPYFDETTVGFGEGLLWIMYQYYTKYIEKGLSVKPKAVIEYTDKYWLEKDMYLQFSSERVVNTCSEDDFITISDMQDEFNEWYSVAYSKKVPPTRPKLVEELKRLWGEPVNGCWTGLKRRVVQYQEGQQGGGGVSFGNAFASYF